MSRVRPGDELQIRHHKRLQPGAEAAAGAADALGDGTDLAVVLGQERDDPVRLAQLVGAQHHGVIPVGACCKGWIGHG